jgi:DNA-binding CsgD family transcriptional regulator
VVDSSPTLSRAPLVGRDAELRLVTAAIDRAQTSQGGAVILSGEPGIGKTRLAREALDLAASRDFLVLEGRSSPMDSELAYAPLLEALGRLLRGLGEKRRASLVSDLPDLGRLLGDLPVRAPEPIGDPALEKTRLFDAVARLVDRLASSSPVALFFDDLQWADQASLELLHHLARGLGSRRVLLLATWREEGAMSGGLRAMLSSLRRLGAIVEISLSRLDPAAVEHLAGGLLKGSAPNDLMGAIAARASGVPLFVETLLRSLVDSGQLVRSGSGWTLVGTTAVALPPIVRDLMLERIERLGAHERSVLAAIAVNGGPIPHDRLLAACGLDEEAMLSAFSRLRQAGLGMEEPDQDRVLYAVTHPLVLEVAYAELPEITRRRMHFAIASLLEESAPEEIDHLARHYRSAGAFADPRRVLEVVLRAGQRALELCANEEAASNFAAALARVREGHRSELLPEVLEKLGLAWQRVGKGAAAIALLMEALAVREASGDVRAALALRQRLAFAEWDLGRIDRAKAHIEAAHQALALVNDPLEHARLLHAHALLLERGGDLVQLQEVLRTLRSIAQHRREARLEVEVALADARLALRQGRRAESSDHARAAVAGAREIGDRALLLRTLELSCVVAIERAELERDVEDAQECLELSIELGSPGSQMRAHGQRGIAYLLLGRWDESEGEARSALAIARRFDIARGLSRCPLMFALLECQRGNLAAATAHIAEAHEGLPSAGGDRFVRATYALASAWLAIEQEDATGTDAFLEDLAAKEGDALAQRLFTLVEIHLLAGRIDEAEQVASALLSFDDTPALRGFAALGEGLVRSARADASAIDRFREAAALFHSARMPFFVARSELAASRTKDRAPAITHAQKSLEIFTALGAKRWSDRARKRLRELGERPAPVRRAGPGGSALSRRELEVALLFAQGLSTAEVAKELIISPHTVAAHLQRIYRRLELSSRAALTRWLAEQGLL